MIRNYLKITSLYSSDCPECISRQCFWRDGQSRVGPSEYLPPGDHWSFDRTEQNDSLQVGQWIAQWDAPYEAWYYYNSQSGKNNFLTEYWQGQLLTSVVLLTRLCFRHKHCSFTFWGRHLKISCSGVSTWSKPTELEGIEFTDPVPDIVTAKQKVKVRWSTWTTYWRSPLSRRRTRLTLTRRRGSWRRSVRDLTPSETSETNLLTRSVWLLASSSTLLPSPRPKTKVETGFLCPRPKYRPPSGVINSSPGYFPSPSPGYYGPPQAKPQPSYSVQPQKPPAPVGKPLYVRRCKKIV